MSSFTSIFRAFHDGLTIPEVSGIIAAGIFVAQFILPIVLPVVLIAFLEANVSAATMSAVTWSVVGRFLHSSSWPSILSADSASNSSVPARVLAVTRLSTLMAVLIAVAGILTPIGLYPVVEPDPPTLSTFNYSPDPSQFGYGTPPRTELPWSRICGGWVPVACPNSFNNVSYHINATGEYSTIHGYYDSQVPQYVIDTFQSGLTAFNRSVSSLFDIQSRYYTWSLESKTPDPNRPDNGSSYPLSSVRQLANLIMERKVVLVEGLIVDMVNGGVGFRNHSVPPYQGPGSEWSEDILFVEPESQCVDTNLTIDFTIPQYYANDAGPEINVVLTDRGGFTNLNRTLPKVNVSNSQHNPNLHDRAYQAAWVNNAYSMAFMNVTNVNNQSDPDSEVFGYLNSTVGKRFPLARENSFMGVPVNPYSLRSSTSFGQYLDGLDKGDPGSNYTALNGTNVTVPPKPPLYSNPFNISNEQFSNVGPLCKGADSSDTASIDTIAAQCGLLYGAPRLQDGNHSQLVTPGSNWTIPLYSCISMTKAMIKTVTFQSNGSNDLSGVTVTGRREKEYRTESSKPLWGVEKTNMSLRNVYPLWGLISSAYHGNISLSTIRKESLYIPGYVTLGVSTGEGYQNLPGVNFPSQSLGSVFKIGSMNEVDSYSGKDNLALLRHWREYSGNASSAGQILDLIWTDKAANIVVGTRGMHNIGLQHKDEQTPETPSYDDLALVTFYHHRIRYHLPYAIPAIIILALGVFILLATLMSCVLNPGFSKMRRLLTATSQGRLMFARGHMGDDTGTHPDQAKDGHVAVREYTTEKPGSGKQWRRTVGMKKVSVAQDGDQLVILDPEGSTSDVRLPQDRGVRNGA